MHIMSIIQPFKHIFSLYALYFKKLCIKNNTFRHGNDDATIFSDATQLTKD